MTKKPKRLDRCLFILQSAVFSCQLSVFINLLTTDYRQLTTDDKETKEIRQVFICSPVGSLQLSVVSLRLVCQLSVFILSRRQPYSSTRSTFSLLPRRC